MTPVLPPESGDLDMWGALSRACGQLAINFMAWANAYGAPMATAFFAVWLYGLDHGYSGRKLKLKIASGLLCAYIGAPLVLDYFDVAPIWATGLCSFLAVGGFRYLKWVEAAAMRRMGIERRSHQDAEE